MIESRRHGDLAESILARSPNAWLRGLLDIQYSCIHYLAGAYPDALRFAVRAIETTRQSGDHETKVVALIDLAASYLALGQQTRASRCVGAAVACSDPQDQAYGLLTETLAEIRLSERDYEGCQSLLNEAHLQAAALVQVRPAWYRTWNERTELRLLMQRGRPDDVVTLLEHLPDQQGHLQHSFADRRIFALKARALVNGGEIGRTSDLLASLLSDVRDRSLLTLGQVFDVLGSFVSQIAGTTQAEPFRSRALRMLASGAESGAHVDAVDQYISDMESGHHTTRLNADSPSPHSLRRPHTIYCHLDASSPRLPEPPVDCSEFLSFVVAIPTLLGQPHLMAEELVRLLIRLGWIRAGHVEVSSSDGRRCAVWSSYGQLEESHSGMPSRTNPAAAVLIHLGQEARQTVTLHVQPSIDARSQTNCALLRRLIENSTTPTTAPTADSRPDGRRVVADDSRDSGGVFRSRAMVELVDTARKIATLDVTILLTGESGTGKEVVARIVHAASHRSLGPFVPFNCAGMPKDLVDSQLFGHRRGAFTGATESFEGVVRAAARGTLFLDEIAELPLDVQPKLLRFLDAMEVHPLGESKPQRVDVRVVAATNANLEQLVADGRFREDLFYRLNIFRFRLPPLRERREEIPELVQSFLEEASREFDKHGVRLSDESVEHLMLGRWPGNLRQLKHEIWRIVALAQPGSVVLATDLSSDVLAPGPVQRTNHDGGTPSALSLAVDRPLNELFEELERAAISQALISTEGRMEEAAARLGLSRKGLYLKRRRLGL
jgi:DNA-binding NtrC family response regulator